MDSNNYNSFIIEKINENKQTAYIKTVGRQLTVFHSPHKIEEYIESKTNRIFLDYDIEKEFKWHKKSKILLNNEGVLFPHWNLEKNKNKFLTHIPYSLAWQFYLKSNQQDLISLSFNDWLSFFTNRFFGLKCSINSKIDISLIKDSLFIQDLKKLDIYKNINEKKVSFFQKDKFYSFSYNADTFFLFYMKFNNRNFLFKIQKSSS